MFTNEPKLRFVVLRVAFVLVAAATLRPAMADVVDPFQGDQTELIPFEEEQAATQTPLPIREGSGEGSLEQSPNNATEINPQRSQAVILPVQYQSTDQTPQTPLLDDNADAANAPSAPSAMPGPSSEMKDPCAAAPNKPFMELGINIALPAGKLPTDYATACWEQINHDQGPTAAARSWPVFCYQWEATCLCYQPLYFEEANLERYGYQCGDKCAYPCECCVQPFASAAHFFGTVPLLPYCMADDCPGNCNYTLGHYRPGSSPPWRWHWPSYDPLAAAAYAGFWVGMVAMFP